MFVAYGDYSYVVSTMFISLTASTIGSRSSLSVGRLWFVYPSRK